MQARAEINELVLGNLNQGTRANSISDCPIFNPAPTACNPKKPRFPDASDFVLDPNSSRKKWQNKVELLYTILTCHITLMLPDLTPPAATPYQCLHPWPMT